jgi:thiol-disulfide isomerase/thioredoxin
MAAAAQPPVTVQFFKLPLAEAKKRAAEIKKPLLVQFSATWCMPCQWMDKNTYNDIALADYLNANYFPVKIDVDELQGYNDKEANNVNFLPTILIFNASGNLIGRYEESLTPERLLELAKKYDTVENRTSGRPTGGAPGSSTSSMDHLNKPGLAPAGRAPKTYPANRTEQLGSTPSRLSPSMETSAVVPVNSEANPYAARQMAIQVGVYSNYENVIRQVQALEKKINKRVNIVSQSENGKTVYKVVIGPFDSAPSTLPYLDLLRKEGIQGIVKDWQSL